MNAKIQVIVGLGNPGTDYEKTRHNAGCWFVDSLLTQHSSSWRQEKKLFGHIADIQSGNRTIKLFKSSNYMNLSGQAIAALLKYFNLQADNILIAHDDIDLEVGQIKFKFDGGHGGHNGLRNIIQAIGTKAFHRLRIGVGHPGNSSEVHDYVLKRPIKSHKIMIDNAIEDALMHIPEFLQGNFSKATQLLHTGDSNGI